jgi:hypothetical protein
MVNASLSRRLESVERRLRVLQRPTISEVLQADERECIRIRHKLFSRAAQKHPELTPDDLPPEFAASAERDRATLAECRWGESGAKAKRDILERLARCQGR